MFAPYNSFKYHNVRRVWGGYLYAEPRWHRGGKKHRKGPYNKTIEMQRRVRQQALS